MQSFNIGGCESCQGFKTDAFDRHMMHHSTLCTLALWFLFKLRFWEHGKLIETFRYQLGFLGQFSGIFSLFSFAVFLLQKTR